MTSFKKSVCLLVVLMLLTVTRLAEAHAGHSHDGVAGGESHVALLATFAAVGVAIAVGAFAYVRARRR